MNRAPRLAPRLAFALLLCATTWQAAAADFFWNCTTPDGIKYADATQCDKGDTAVKVMKGNAADPVATPAVQAAAQPQEKSDGPVTGVCPADPGYCAEPGFGVTEGSHRAQAIAQFMRERECALMKRFPQRCTKPN